MRIEVKACVSAILLMLLFFVVIGMNTSSGGSYGEGTRSIPQAQSKVYINGDWNVTTDTIRSNETIILSGNLTVLNNASLTFKNVTLIMNCTSAGQYIIEVKPGSSMYILDLDDNNMTTEDASNITAADSNYPYLFWVDDGTHFEMRNSELHRCGITPAIVSWSGLYIQTDDAIIEHNLISHNADGIVLYGSDATISNNTITWNGDTGIRATTWSNATIENNWITWNKVYGIEIDGWDNTHGPWPSNPLVIGNVIAHTGRDLGPGNGDGIHITYASNPIIKNTQILKTGEDAVYSSDGSTPTLINVTIDGANYGIASSSTGYIYIINSTIINAKIQDFSIADSYFVVTNSTFNKVWISNEYSNLTVRWYLHVYVEDSNHQPIPAADVRVRDNENGTYDKNFSTDSNGYVKWIVVTEYWRNNDTIIYYTPYNITVNYSGLTFINNPRNSTINESKTEVFTATTPVPEFENIIIPLIITITVCILFINQKKNPYKIKKKRRKEHEKGK